MENKKDVRINVRMSESLRLQAEKIAKEKKITFSELVREGLRRMIL